MQRAVHEPLVRRGQVQGGHDVIHLGLDMELERLLRQPSLMDRRDLGSPPVGCITPQDLLETCILGDSVRLDIF